MSLPSPGSHWNVSSPAPRKAVSLPPLPSMKSLPSPPRRTSLPSPPVMVSRTAIDRETDQGGQAVASGDDVVAPVHVEDQVLGGADVDRERDQVGPVEADPVPVGRDCEQIGRGGAIDLDRVDPGSAL